MIAEMATQDLVGDSNPGRGAPGLTGEQVVRAMVIKQMNGFSYEELAFHIQDSAT
jgi:IS5 family transposase